MEHDARGTLRHREQCLERRKETASDRVRAAGMVAVAHSGSHQDPARNRGQLPQGCRNRSATTNVIEGYAVSSAQSKLGFAEPNVDVDKCTFIDARMSICLDRLDAVQLIRRSYVNQEDGNHAFRFGGSKPVC
jgi:hypothetical protein